MANPPIGRRFEKGNKANPLGAGAHNPAVKMIKKLSNDQIAELGAIILEGNPDKLKEIINNPKSTVLQVAICSVLVKAINKGDMAAINALLDRIVGKVKDVQSHEGSVGINVTITDYTNKKVIE